MASVYIFVVRLCDKHIQIQDASITSRCIYLTLDHNRITFFLLLRVLDLYNMRRALASDLVPSPDSNVR